MSADNYVICPQCKAAGFETKPKNPLREYWDIGISEDGVLLVDYRCECSVCDFKFEYSHTEPVPLKGKEVPK